MTIDEKGFGNRVRSQREYMKMTQTELAKKIGIGNSTISCWETRHSCPSSGIIRMVSIALECDYHWLLCGAPQVPVAETETVESEPVKIESSIGDIALPSYNDIFMKRIASNLDYLGGQAKEWHYVSKRTTLEEIFKLAEFYKVDPAYLFVDHELERIEEELDGLYEKIEELQKKKNELLEEDTNADR